MSSTTIAITAATGELGVRVVEQLAEAVKKQQTQPKIIVIVRSAEKAKPLQEKYGVEVRVADYTDAAALESALAGVTKLLFISGSAIGQRVPQHTNVINAAQKAGVSFVAYTSLLKADRKLVILADEHAATEDALTSAVKKNSAFPGGVALLRNGFYNENDLAALGPALEHGALLGAANEGKLSTASRDDYAAAAVAVLLAESAAGIKTYELAGDESYTRSQLASIIASASGKPVVYKNLPESEYAKVLEGFGLPPPVAATIANVDANAANGALFDDSKTLSKLIGRPTTPMEKTIKAALPK